VRQGCPRWLPRSFKDGAPSDLELAVCEHHQHIRQSAQGGLASISARSTVILSGILCSGFAIPEFQEIEKEAQELQFLGGKLIAARRWPEGLRRHNCRRTKRRGCGAKWLDHALSTNQTEGEMTVRIAGFFPKFRYVFVSLTTVPIAFSMSANPDMCGSRRV